MKKWLRRVIAIGSAVTAVASVVGDVIPGTVGTVAAAVSGFLTRWLPRFIDETR